MSLITPSPFWTRPTDLEITVSMRMSSNSMNVRRFVQFTAASALALMHVSAWSQNESAPMSADPGAQERREIPDTPGTGPFPAIKEEVASLPQHVVYRPADLSKLGGKTLGVLAWGNGGCSNDGASSRLHLLEIASHGYLAIALGRIRTGPGATVPPAPRTPPAPPTAGGAPPSLPPPATDYKALLFALDWAFAQNADPASPLYGKIDPAAVAVSGFSCGGLQAIQVAADPRIK